MPFKELTLEGLVEGSHPRDGYDRIPGSTLEAVLAWVNQGLYPGDFLTAVLKNDLKKAVAHADQWNREALFPLVILLFNRVPMACWGDPERVHTWSGHEGYRGYGEYLNRLEEDRAVREG